MKKKILATFIIVLLLQIQDFSKTKLEAQELTIQDYSPQDVALGWHLDWRVEWEVKNFKDHSRENTNRLNKNLFNGSYLSLGYKNRSETFGFIGIFDYSQYMNHDDTSEDNGFFTFLEFDFNFLKTIFSGHYDSKLPEEQQIGYSTEIGILPKSSGQFFVKKNKNTKSLSNFRQGGKNLFLESTNIEDRYLDNNSINSTEFGLRGKNFELSLVVNQNYNQDFVFGVNIPEINYAEYKEIVNFSSGVSADIFTYFEGMSAPETKIEIPSSNALNDKNLAFYVILADTFLLLNDSGIPTQDTPEYTAFQSAHQIATNFISSLTTAEQAYLFSGNNNPPVLATGNWDYFSYGYKDASDDLKNKYKNLLFNYYATEDTFLKFNQLHQLIFKEGSIYEYVFPGNNTSKNGYIGLAGKSLKLSLDLFQEFWDDRIHNYVVKESPTSAIDFLRFTEFLGTSNNSTALKFKADLGIFSFKTINSLEEWQEDKYSGKISLFGASIKAEIFNINLFINHFQTSVSQEYDDLAVLKKTVSVNNLDFGIDFKIGEMMSVSLSGAEGNSKESLNYLANLATQQTNSNLDGKNFINTDLGYLKHNSHKIIEIGFSFDFNTLNNAKFRFGLANILETGESDADISHISLDGLNQLKKDEVLESIQAKIRLDFSF